jgi:hypothetical protein
MMKFTPDSARENEILWGDGRGLEYVTQNKLKLPQED